MSQKKKKKYNQFLEFFEIDKKNTRTNIIYLKKNYFKKKMDGRIKKRKRVKIKKTSQRK